jgi:hypothetical protein
LAIGFSPLSKSSESSDLVQGIVAKGKTVTFIRRQYRRWLLSLLLTVALAAHALAQQPRTFQYIYDDTGQIKKVIDTTTGECLVYSYDQVGNITDVGRRSNCLAPPTFQSITPGTAPNCFTVTGQNLLGATVTTDIPGASVTDIKSSDDDTSVSFCLLAPTDSCNLTGTATITTPTGSVQAPVSVSGATPLTPDVIASGDISIPTEKDRYCFALSAPARVVVQMARPSAHVDPCLELFSGSPATPVANGTACASNTFDESVARLNLQLAAGTYFVVVSDTANNETGPYNLVLEVLTDGATLTPDVPVSDTIAPVGDLDVYTFTLATAARVVVQMARPSANVDPCLELFSGSPAVPVPSGTACASNTFDESVARLNLQLAAGTYFVVVSDTANNETGPYNLVLEVLTDGTPLTPGTATADTITPVGDLDLFTFTLAATKQVTVQVTPSGIQPCIELFKGTPAAPVSGGSTCSNGTAQLNLSLVPETYFVLVSDSGNNNTGSYSVLLQVP